MRIENEQLKKQIVEVKVLETENERLRKLIKDLTKQLDKKKPSTITVKGKTPKAPIPPSNPEPKLEPEAQPQPQNEDEDSQLDLALELLN